MTPNHPHPPLTRRAFLRASAAAVAGVSLAGMASSCGSTSPTIDGPDSVLDVTIGYVPIACAAPLVLASAQKLFDQHGVNVVLRKYAGRADLWSAYSTGELNVAHMLAPMPLAINAGAANGQRPTEVAFTQNTNGQAITLAEKHVGRAQSAKDFSGMVIGIPFEFSVHALLLRDFLVAGGVDPVRDLELRLLRPADMIAQLQVGGIDGFIGPEPFNQRAVATGAGRIFTLTKELWSGHPCCSIAMSKEWRTAHPEKARRITAALTQASQMANDPAQKDQVAEILSREKYLNQKRELFLPTLAGTYQNWEGEEKTDHERISFGDPTNPTAIIWMATQLARWNLGGDTLTMDDPTLIHLADSVLPDDVPRGGDPVTINGRVFDAHTPTAGYEVYTR